MHIVVTNGAILLVIKFRISGSLRFLSHAETVRLFQRACTRAGLKIQYSRGFNPRPKLSLPLPRPVGIASDDELLCFRMNPAMSDLQVADYESQIKDCLSAQLPRECELLSISVAQANTSVQPCSVTYVFTVRREHLDDKLKDTIEHLLASDNLSLERRIHKKNLKLKTQNSKLKKVDVRGFLKSIDLEKNNIIVECNVSPSGSIRVDEILKLMRLDIEKLTLPIRRTNIQWRKV